MATAEDIVTQHLRNTNTFETRIQSNQSPTPRNSDSESSTVNESPRTEKPSPSPSERRPSHPRQVSRKSTTSMVDGNVDTLVRILSRRTTTGDGDQSTSPEDYEHDLEEIMGDIFGPSDQDLSKRKHVGVIWKNLTVSQPTMSKV